MPNLALRTQSPELMDDLSCSTEELHSALRALTRMNTLSLSAHFIANEITRFVGDRNRTIRILDLGSGRGDILCSVVEQLEKSKLNVEAIGIDMNSKSVELANQFAKRRGGKVSFLTAKAIEAASDMEYDVAISSLFLHHLTEDEIISLFTAIKGRASLGLVMNDLERSHMSYGLTWVVTHLLSRSFIAQHDGLVSVQGALLKQELQLLAIRAELQSCKFARTLPFRIMISWEKTLCESALMS